MKRTSKFSLLLITCLTASLASHAQFKINGKPVVYDQISNTYMASLPEATFGKDYPAVITLDTDSAWSQLKIEGTNIGEANYIFQKVEGNKEYTLQAKRVQQADQSLQDIQAKITFTFLPLLDLKGSFGYEFANGSLTLLAPDDTEPVTTLLKAKWRGGSTNVGGKHKRNYKIKTLNEKGKSKDISFMGMREDNNWILDAGQIDLFRLRNRIATELWNDFATKPYYADKEPKAQSGVSGKVVEVILNNEYAGIYSLTEAMDRKEMKLKKYDEKKQEFHGQMWKVSSWDKAEFWDIAKDYNNNQETWHAFETKYPDFEDVNPTDYSALYHAIDFVANSDDNTFREEVENYFDIPVLIDYHILTEVTLAKDNTGKNLYWSIYDRDKCQKLTLSIWDLDATMGQFWSNDPIYNEETKPDQKVNINYFNLYNRLIALNVNNYNQKLLNRYKTLRKTYLNTETLIKRYRGYYNILAMSGAASREERKWSKDSDISGCVLDFKHEIEYLDSWIRRRMEYLDSELSPLYTNINTEIAPSQKKQVAAYNLLGQKVLSSYKGIIIANGKKYIKIKK